MSEADRIYREKARRQEELQRRQQAATEAASVREKEALLQEISDASSAVLSLLEQAGFSHGVLLKVQSDPGFFRRSRMREVAAWHLYSTMLSDDLTRVDIWLLSIGKFAYGSFPVDLHDKRADTFFGSYYPAILSGLRHLESRLRNQEDE